ncbi:MAG: alpha-2-macroglobulin [Enterovirga sp.]|nr:alpha-2-macroglobulin [Enterovirga sp.]
MKRLVLAVALVAASLPALGQNAPLRPEPLNPARAAPAQNLAAEPRSPVRQPAAQLDRLMRSDGVSVVPEKFLRRWDPVTVFFETDTGPATGGPEDDPARVVTMSPTVAGAWQWLNARTLQFRPAEPWRPLSRVEIAAAGRTTRLVPLLPTPVATSPEPARDGIAGLDQIGLTFSEPVEIEALRRLLTVEIRPLPGLATGSGQVLGAGDLDLKALERAKRADDQSYVVRLRQPVPDGRLAILRLRLSDEVGLDDPSFELALRSAVPFATTELTCGRGLSRTIRDGITLCDPNEDGSSEEDGEYRAGPKRSFVVGFSAEPDTPDVLGARAAFRITPAVDDLVVARDGNRLRVSGRFRADAVYDLRIEPGSLKDARGRALGGEPLVAKLAFLPDRPRLKWDAAQGIAERFGPQMIPLRGRGYDRADIRVHPIDPLARHFWPFPSEGLETDDDAAPPLSGNEPGLWTDKGDIGRDAMAQRIRALGSPALSELVRLPTRRGGVEAKFGLDLKPFLAKVAGPEQPGTYLVGLRPTDGGKRRWIRIQVTDLVLTAVEEAERVRFAVTSLASARPVADAEIRLEGLRNDRFVTLGRGRTDGEGAFSWTLAARQKGEIKRIVVQKGLDTLVLEPERGPSEYREENWTKPEAPWLAWSVQPDEKRKEEARTLCHVFTERPIYRPEEPVHVKGFVRRYLGGGLFFTTKGGTLIVSGPGEAEWRYPVTLDQVGGFYHKFDVATEATGDYAVRFQPDGEEETCGLFPFKKEAYRLPTFEVQLNGPTGVPLDGEFSVDLLAKYFAGGLVAERPIKWRVTQFPHAWTPPGRDGFLFSSDSRFSGDAKFRSTPVLEREAKTDAGGAARLTLDPTVEPTAQPRRYSVEATVTGEDDIQVRSIQTVVALPPFTLGVKIPRYLPQTGTIEPEILAVKADGAPLPGLELTVKLVRRNWSSILQASDFSQGSAKYVTQIIDETLVERKVTSAAEPTRLSFEAREAGVYLVQVEASDRIGRRQIVSVDFFMGGNTPVTWSRPPAETVAVTTEKEEYAPGETATLVVQSPFQSARALAVVEEPEGRFRYDWIDIQNGFGRYELTLRKEEMPKLAVHFLVMRGRLAGAEQSPTAPFDGTKPVTVAATKWIKVSAVKNIVVAALQAPARARPGDEVEVTLRLSDESGRPLAGEATFWMVDQAVLSLARERPLDPLPAFVVNRPTRMAARDTRNMAFGVIPLDENPGGDEAVDDWGIENISVRKNFTPVPIYLPRVPVGEDGIARVKVKLPDTLTVFKLRAKAVSGPDRFGFATGEMAVRQEIVAQPALPRFVRPGDRFEAGLIGRVVEGPGGSGRVALSVEGASADGPRDQPLTWEQNRPARADFPVTVGEPRPGEERARLRFVLQRDADKAGDAVQIDLPIRPDRPPVRRREVSEIAPGKAADFAPPSGAVRPGSYSRSLTVANDAVVVRLVGGMSYLVEYPYGCTEQRIAIASSALALKPFAPILQASGFGDRLGDSVRSTARVIQSAIDEDGLVAFWPKSRGTVSLTAWAYRFLVSAERAGEPVDKALTQRLGKVLTLAMRSDYPRLLRGDELRERVEALTALAEGGAIEENYATELARRADAMPTLALAEATAALAKLPGEDRQLQERLLDTLWSRMRILSRDGRPVYSGMVGESASALILPSETKTLAEAVRATAVAAAEDSRNAVLRDGLIRLGEGNGWGTTNANAAAIRALAETWRGANASIPVGLSRPGASERVTLGGSTPLVQRVSTTLEPQRVENGGNRAIVALLDTRYQPVEPGYLAKPAASGFVLSRSLARVPGGSAPLERLAPDAENAIRLKVGDVVEETAELVNAEDRTHVAIRLPLAAGLEPLNPNLVTAPAEAAPSAGPTLAPTYVAFGDDHVLYAYDSLPKGNYRFVFRTRALIPGSFTAPPGEAETMYQPGIYGASGGMRVVIGR